MGCGSSNSVEIAPDLQKNKPSDQEPERGKQIQTNNQKCQFMSFNF